MDGRDRGPCSLHECMPVFTLNAIESSHMDHARDATVAAAAREYGNFPGVFGYGPSIGMPVLFACVRACRCKLSRSICAVFAVALICLCLLLSARVCERRPWP